jgi:hypothetical protein
LGYQHRGIERAMLGGPNPRSIHYMETLAGDTSAGHAIAYCTAIEALARTQVPARRRFAASGWNSRGLPITSETLAPWPAMSVFCRPCRTAVASAVTC